jgi:aryl-alcohol dehydrogenase-like predicted oxidoreductase
MRESERDIISRVEALAKKKGVGMAQIATAWVLSKDGILSLRLVLMISCDGSDCWVEFRKANPRDG